MQCLINKKVIELVKYEQQINLDIAINAKKNYQHRRESEENAIRTVTGIILMAAEFFNLKTPMTEVQAVQTASLFLESYPVESIEDLILCLKQAKTGEFGTVYNRIDGQVIFDWFRQYLDAKYRRVEEIKQNEKINHQQQNQESVSGRKAEIIKEILAKTEQAKTEQRPPRSITEKSHFNHFVVEIQKYPPEKLIELRKYYENESKKYFRTSFENYIDAIDERLKSLTPKKAAV